MSKYLINHFSITPENFSSSLKNVNKIKSLFIPHSSQPPKIYFEDPIVLKQTLYIKDLTSLMLVPLHPYYHMYVDNISMVDHKNVNLVATYLYRYSLSTLLGYKTTTFVCGDVLIFGSVNALTQDNHDIDYSVPYEVVEQVSRYYDQGVVH